MKLVTTLATTLLATIAISGLALAQDASKDAKKAPPGTGSQVQPPPTTPTPPEPPKPSPELEAYMKPFVGTWKCESTFAAGSFGPTEVKTKSSVQFKKEHNGFVYRGIYKVSKSKTVPMAFQSEFFITYDAGSKTVVFSGVDSFGGATWASGKIEGTSATVTGEAYMMGAKVKVRESMWTKDKTGGHKMEVDMGKGFQLMGSEECKR